MRTMPYRLKIFTAAIVLAILFAGCRDKEADPAPTRDPALSGTGVAGQPETGSGALATVLPTATPTPSVTPTPTITPTPWPTARAVTLEGDPLALSISEPAPQPGAPCGVVDRLDFPLDPPDADDITRGGQDFGVFRRRYDGYHTGEDWWGPNRRRSFGTPVYSVGHGQVTYANPWGWGADQGVVIVRHVLADGSTFLSFYGHLDPPSIVLRHGNCVARGDQIGKIGRPRSSPHLHFEIRNHTPDDPGPGYWSTDPRSAGWMAPSETIWNQRLSISPGVQWFRPFETAGTLGLGTLNGHAVIVENSALVALNPADGNQLWQQPIFDLEELEDIEVEASLIETITQDAREPIVYTADQRGYFAAFRLPDGATTDGSTTIPTPERLWELDMHNVWGVPGLIPLPDGGVALVVDERLIALSSNGAILWRQSFDAEAIDWLQWGDKIIFSTAGEGSSLWTLDNEGVTAWETSLGGSLIHAGEQLLLYSGDGLYRLDPETRTVELFFRLPRGLASQGDVEALPDGGFLVAHMDAAGRRLLALNADGTMRWQRSYADRLDGKPQLLVMDGQLFLLSEETNGSWNHVSLYAIGLEDASLTRLFNGGTRVAVPDNTWALPTGNGQLLINIGGGSLVAFDPQLAMQTVCSTGTVTTCSSQAVGNR